MAKRLKYLANKRVNKKNNGVGGARQSGIFNGMARMLTARTQHQWRGQRHVAASWHSIGMV